MEQFGFIPDRSIHQCIALGHDLVSDINNKVHGGNVLVKLDMAKAFDRLSWLFLIRGMKALGFSDVWCDLIYRNISNCWYSIRIRGKSFGHFKSNRGLRQGDPISSSLFVIAMEILSQKLNIASNLGGGLMPYWSSLRALEINHILFADDILIFTNGGKSSFSSLLAVLKSFCCNSGQKLNPSKCKIFFSKHISVHRRDGLLNLSGYSPGTFPTRYLGAPLFPGRPRLSYFQPMIDNIKLRVNGWMNSFLSFAGKVTLIRSVLQSIPIHCLSVLPVPKGFLRSIDQVLRNFLWNNCSENRRHWVNWGNICQPTSSGGLGIKNLTQVMSSLRGKLAWTYLSQSSLWAKHARSRYKVGRSGFALWKTLSPYISSLAHDSRWILGNGQTDISLFCHCLGMPTPRSLASKSIKEVLLHSDLRRLFLHNLNPRILNSIGGDFHTDAPDLLIWERNPQGIVTTANFLRDHLPPLRNIKKFEIIWNPWLPFQTSCFLWKVLCNALPTDDIVMSTGLPFASRCVCCKNPQTESLEHLLIFSDHASMLFNFLCPLFRKARPISIHDYFYHWGIHSNFSTFSDRMGFALSSCCLWDIWKLRNQLRFGDIAGRFTKCNILNWAYSLSRIFKGSFGYDATTIPLCNVLHITPPVSASSKIMWFPWLPFPNGNTCNVAISTGEASSLLAAIIRDTNGSFIAGFKHVLINKHFLQCLLHILNELKSRNLHFKCLKIAHSDAFLLSRASMVDWPHFQVKRLISRLLQDISIYKVSHSLNRPANALCFSSVRSAFFSCSDDLPIHVMLALQNDVKPQPCSFYNHCIFV